MLKCTKMCCIDPVYHFFSFLSPYIEHIFIEVQFILRKDHLSLGPQKL